MNLADPEAALAKLIEFRALLVGDEHALQSRRPRRAKARRSELQPLIERIANELDPGGAARLKGKWSNSGQRITLNGAINETDRLIGILKQREDYQQILSPVGPTLAGSQLHPWVWDAAASLWDDGHHDPAVHEATKAVELRTQLKINRRDIDGKDLYAQSFSIKDPKTNESRLRFSHIDKTAQPKYWTSAHEGAMFLGMGCSQGIRNPRAHP